MSKIDIIFGAVENSSPPLYIEQKIRAMFLAAELVAGNIGRNRLTPVKLRKYVNALVESRKKDGVPSLPVVSRYDLKRCSAAERRIIDRRIRCLLDTVNSQFPLLDGEHVLPKGDFPAYLKSAWHGYPRATALLRRRTNMATTYYMVPDTFVDARNRRVVVQAQDPRGREMRIKAAYQPDFGKLARDIAKGLAGKAPSPFNIIGAFLIDQFWSSGSKANEDWQKVYQNLQEIVKNGLADAEVKRAAAKVKGFVNFLSTEYVELKKSQRKRPDALLQAMQPYDTAFFMDIVNIFMFTEKPTADIAAASLANFMLGANLHIALNQERALVDPDYTDDPGQSPYAKTAANLARLYGDYAKEAAPGVVSARTKQITGIKTDHDTHCQGGAAAHCTTTWYYWFEDNNPKPKYKSKVYSYVDADKHPPDAKKQATDARKAHIKKITDELDLQTQVYDVVAYWTEVAKNPVALSYSAPTTAPGIKADGWASQVPVRGSRRWRDGYAVRYAVTYFINRQETEKGPWWSPKGADKEGYFAGSPDAFPTLTDLPIDPFYHAEGRRLYRQFKNFKEEMVATIKDNQTVEHLEKKK